MKWDIKLASKSIEIELKEETLSTVSLNLKISSDNGDYETFSEKEVTLSKKEDIIYFESNPILHMDGSVLGEPRDFLKLTKEDEDGN